MPFAASGRAAPHNDLRGEQAMFGRFGRAGGIRKALIASAGMMAWRWWKNRQALNREPRAGQAGPDVRRTYDTGQTNLSGESY
jgi:hypothetical protein